MHACVRAGVCLDVSREENCTSRLGVGACIRGHHAPWLKSHRVSSEVPTVFKDYADFVVLASGVAEILLGLGLIIAWKYRVQVGWAVAIFFVAIF